MRESFIYRKTFLRSSFHLVVAGETDSGCKGYIYNKGNRGTKTSGTDQIIPPFRGVYGIVRELFLPRLPTISRNPEVKNVQNRDFALSNPWEMTHVRIWTPPHSKTGARSDLDLSGNRNMATLFYFPVSQTRRLQISPKWKKNKTAFPRKFIFIYFSDYRCSHVYF